MDTKDTKEEPALFFPLYPLLLFTRSDLRVLRGGPVPSPMTPRSSWHL
jgi:hypothetical protein